MSNHLKPMREGSNMTVYLAVDLGGTKTELAIFQQGENFVPLAQTRYLNSEFNGFSEIVRLFLSDCGHQVKVAAIGIAGLVDDGVAKVTNLPWVIREDELKDEFGFEKVLLLNDLTAVCSSISVLTEDDILELYPGEKDNPGMRGVVAPGTGLGEGYLLEEESLFLPRGSEGGHTNFAPTNSLQAELLRWMQQTTDPVSYEHLIAGPGIARLYDFFVQAKGEQQSPQIQKALVNAVDRTPVIANGAFGEIPCPLCRKVIQLFIEILGSELGNLALKLYATGGMYIGGGIVPRLVGKLYFDALVEAYLDKGKMKGLVGTIPLYLITRKDAALLGTANYCEVKGLS